MFFDEFLHYPFPPDWQQCWRIRQASQDHGEEVQENKIPQVHAHLGFAASGVKAGAWLCHFSWEGPFCLLDVLLALEAVVVIWGPYCHLKPTRSWVFETPSRSADQNGMDEGRGLILCIFFAEDSCNSQHWVVGGPAVSTDSRECSCWPTIYLYSLSWDLKLHLVIKEMGGKKK